MNASEAGAVRKSDAASAGGPLIRRRGLLIVISSPSGAGKTTIAKALLAAENTTVQMSVSVTTRPQRPSETDGVDYHFIEPAAFERLKREGVLLEHAEVFGYAYGTPAEPITAAIEQGRDILLDIDWQGAQKLAKGQFKADLVRIFILPPSLDELHRRLERRNQDSATVVEKRMQGARKEISHWPEYDYVLVNVDVATCLAELRTVIQAERLRRERRSGISGGLEDFVATLG